MKRLSICADSTAPVAHVRKSTELETLDSVGIQRGRRGRTPRRLPQADLHHPSAAARPAEWGNLSQDSYLVKNSVLDQ